MPVLLWLAAAISVIAACSGRDLWAPDEPRYGVVAREMLETGDLLVPRLAGEPYAEKPPLAFWAMAAAGRVAGTLGAVPARLFGALLAAVAVFSVARLTRRWFGDPAMGDTAGLLFATSGLVLWNGSRAGLDLPMTAFGLLAVEAGTAVVVRRSLAGALGVGAALGAGVLVKGPHALLVPVSAVVGGCLASRAARRLLDPRWLLSAALAAGIVLAWLLPALDAGGAAYRDRLLGQLGDRVAGEQVPHRNSFAYLVLLLPVAALPWTVCAIPGLGAALRPRRHPREHRFGLGAAGAAVLLPLVLLSIPASKRDLYLIPSLPFVACLEAWALHRVREWGFVRSPAHVASYVLALLAFGALAAPIYAVIDPHRFGAAAPLLGRASTIFALGAVALLCAAGSAAAARLRHTLFTGVRAAAIALGAAWIVLATAVLPSFDATKTHRGAAAVADREVRDASLTIAGFSDRSVIWWFEGRAVRQLNDAGSLAALLSPSAPPALVLAKGKHWADLLERSSPSHVSVLRHARLLATHTVSKTPFLLLTNVPSAEVAPGGR